MSHVTPGFWDSKQGRRAFGRGVQEITVEPAASGRPLELSSFPIDQRDGRRKLKVGMHWPVLTNAITDGSRVASSAISTFAWRWARTRDPR